MVFTDLGLGDIKLRNRNYLVQTMNYITNAKLVKF